MDQETYMRIMGYVPTVIEASYFFKTIKRKNYFSGNRN